MKITVLPVSGGGFPSQLAGLIALKGERGPILAASGGNVATYIALAGNYNRYSIERILRMLDSSMLVATWWPELLNFIPSYVAGYSRGSYYNHGTGINNLFNAIFTKDSIKREEIWTGTTNCDSSKSQLFCNLSKGESHLKMKYFRREEYNTLSPKYLNGDIDKIADVTLASASIPGFVPSVKIGKHRYADGGATYSSPLTPMVPVLRHYKQLHIDYINSFDVESKGILCSNTITTVIKTVTSEMIHSMILNDRSVGIQLIRSCDGKLRRVDFGCCPIFLESIEDFRKICDRSMLEFYPCKYYSVEMDRYDAEEAVRIFNLDRNCFKCRFWYVSDQSFESIYTDLFNKCREMGCCNCEVYSEEITVV